MLYLRTYQVNLNPKRKKCIQTYHVCSHILDQFLCIRVQFFTFTFLSRKFYEYLTGALSPCVERKGLNRQNCSGF